MQGLAADIYLVPQRTHDPSEQAPKYDVDLRHFWPKHATITDLGNSIERACEAKHPTAAAVLGMCAVVRISEEIEAVMRLMLFSTVLSSSEPFKAASSGRVTPGIAATYANSVRFLLLGLF